MLRSTSFVSPACLVIAVAPLFLSAESTPAKPETATGYVYHDLNADGIKQPDEVGLADVAVSNGSDVTLTDATGQYSLPVDDDTALFVIKPAGYTVPVNKQMLPQFYYLHKPNGSPTDLKYDGVAPTGPLPESVDFGLYESGGQESFRVLLFGDPQPRTLDHIASFEKDIITEVTNIQGVDFGITLGDIVSDNLDLFDPINTAIAKTGIPFFYVYGNHDMNFDVDHDHLADETFERVYGPATYAFYHGEALFLILDNVIYPNGGGRYIGGFTEKQLTFFENLFETVPEDTLIVLCMHIPLFEEPMFGDTFRDEDRNHLFSLLKKFP
ncbi:MAG: metallophosphoesterase N-terminal domain-containing protein, partial [Verrucomicrobiota bacterium]